MSKQDISASDIDASLNRLRDRLRFEPAIEALYEEQTKQSRARARARVIRSSLITYNILILADYLLLPNTFWLAAFLHFGVVTAVSLSAAAIIQVKPQLMVRESLTVLVPILMFAQIMIIYVANRGQAADNYQYLSILVIVLMNAIQRADFRFAVGTSLLLASAYAAIIWLVVHPPLPTQVVGTAMMVTAVFATLVARRLLERDVRYVFLRRTQDRLQRDAVEAAACRDELTGLFNRRHLDERVHRLWATRDERTSSAAVLMIDVDRFKSFNDRYGHLAGDLCLTRVASAIVAQLSNKDDVAVRFGGEEFLVLLTRTDLTSAVRIAERIRRAIETLAIPHEFSPCGGVVTASFGVVAGPVSQYKVSELIGAADKALYAAKRAGRNKVWPPFKRSDSPAAPITVPIRQLS